MGYEKRIQAMIAMTDAFIYEHIQDICIAIIIISFIAIFVTIAICSNK